MKATQARHGGPASAPMFVTQQRPLRDFLADQDRLATIHADWLYQIASPAGKVRLLQQHGFAPPLAVRPPQPEREQLAGYAFG